MTSAWSYVQPRLAVVHARGAKAHRNRCASKIFGIEFVLATGQAGGSSARKKLPRRARSPAPAPEMQANCRRRQPSCSMPRSWSLTRVEQHQGRGLRLDGRPAPSPHLAPAFRINVQLCSTGSTALELDKAGPRDRIDRLAGRIRYQVQMIGGLHGQRPVDKSGRTWGIKAAIRSRPPGFHPGSAAGINLFLSPAGR